MKYPPYPKYKDSGVDLLGSVPDHWSISRLKWMGDFIIGLTYSPSEVVREAEGTLVLRASNIQGGQIVLNDNVYVDTVIPAKLRTRTNDILICSRNGSQRLVGKTGIIKEREAGCSFGAFTTVFRTPCYSFAFWLLNSDLLNRQAGLFQTSTIYQLTTGILDQIQIALPPLLEQQAIATFLDREAARIDRLIAKKRDLIELLGEKRQALISRCVTRGLPPDAARAAGLDPHPKMKESGIEWLGEVPEHWEVKKLSWLFKFRKGREAATLTKEYIAENQGEYEVHSGQTANDGLMGKINSYEFDFRNSVILVTTVGARAMSTKLLSGRFNLSQNCALLIPVSGTIDCGYFDGVLQPLFGFERGSISLIMQPSLRFEDLYRFSVPEPPLREQKAIAEFLRFATSQISKLVAKAGETIERLQEYRTALITAAVTGKIDVRDAAVVTAADRVSEDADLEAV